MAMPLSTESLPWSAAIALVMPRALLVPAAALDVPAVMSSAQPSGVGRHPLSMTMMTSWAELIRCLTTPLMSPDGLLSKLLLARQDRDLVQPQAPGVMHPH